jgi:hypothetical protein
VKDVPRTIEGDTSQSALDDFEVGDVVQKVGRPWGIWVATLRRVSIGTIGMSSAIGYTAAVLPGLDGDHILNTVCGVIAVLVRAHSEVGLL